MIVFVVRTVKSTKYPFLRIQVDGCEMRDKSNLTQNQSAVVHGGDRLLKWEKIS